VIAISIPLFIPYKPVMLVIPAKFLHTLPWRVRLPHHAQIRLAIIPGKVFKNYLRPFFDPEQVINCQAYGYFSRLVQGVFKIYQKLSKNLYLAPLKLFIFLIPG